MAIIDQYDRKIRYLRISVTDKCNLHCRYCMPVEEEYRIFDNHMILTYEDLLFVVGVFATMGVSRVRLTGGEPLMRRDLPNFASMLSYIDGIDEVNITTNAILLSTCAEKLIDAGIKRINISLDSLKVDRYNYITKSNNYDKAMNGIKSAIDHGFAPIKINVVIVRGFNDDEILDFCKFAEEEKLVVRFIELMPIGNFTDWKDKIVTGNEILDIIASRHKIEALQKTNDTGPAQGYMLSSGAEIGIITPISNHFCDTCDKLRLTADGKLRTCLLSDHETSIFDVARNRDEATLRKLIESTTALKHASHTIDFNSNEHFMRTMSKIGG